MAKSQQKETAEEHYQIPPYYDRYQEEREKRYQSELHRVEDAIERNGKRIDDTNRRIDELRVDMLSRFNQQNNRFDDINRRFDEQASWSKFTYATIVLGMLAILIKLFVG